MGLVPRPRSHWLKPVTTSSLRICRPGAWRRPPATSLRAVAPPSVHGSLEGTRGGRAGGRSPGARRGMRYTPTTPSTREAAFEGARAGPAVRTHIRRLFPDLAPPRPSEAGARVHALRL